jgi:enediyne biosynthesis protein E4
MYIGTRSNRSGIGTRIKCVAGDHQQMDEVRSGGSFLSQNDLRIHFGLGQSTVVDRLEIRWPNGELEILRNIGVDQIVEIEEGRGIIGERKFKR